jgi:hypothetical protein
MPWCDPCGRFYSPNTLRTDGTCPEDHPVETPKPAPRVPWHFWVMLAGITGYLGWRLLEGLIWIF